MIAAVARRVPLVAFALLALVSSAHADPFAVTGGTIRIPSTFGAATFTLEGDGFSLSGNVPQFVGSLTCFPCSSTGGVAVRGPMSDITFGGQPGTFNNVDYPALFFAGVLNVTSPMFSGAMLLDSTTITTPFNFTGLLMGYQTASDALGLGTPLFSAPLVGGGTVTANFDALPVQPGQTPTFEFANATFDFAGDTSATPEPATLALFAMGAGAAAFIRKRRASRS